MTGMSAEMTTFSDDDNIDDVAKWSEVFLYIAIGLNVWAEKITIAGVSFIDSNSTMDTIKITLVTTSDSHWCCRLFAVWHFLPLMFWIVATCILSSRRLLIFGRISHPPDPFRMTILLRLSHVVILIRFLVALNASFHTLSPVTAMTGVVTDCLVVAIHVLEVELATSSKVWWNWPSFFFFASHGLVRSASAFS